MTFGVQGVEKEEKIVCNGYNLFQPSARPVMKSIERLSRSFFVLSFHTFIFLFSFFSYVTCFLILQVKWLIAQLKSHLKLLFCSYSDGFFYSLNFTGSILWPCVACSLLQFNLHLDFTFVSPFQ